MPKKNIHTNLYKENMSESVTCDHECTTTNYTGLNLSHLKLSMYINFAKLLEAF